MWQTAAEKEGGGSHGKPKGAPGGVPLTLMVQDM